MLALVALVTLTPLAYAYPPDQTWHGGLFDNDDDYSRLDLASTFGAALVEPYRPHDHVPTDVAIAVLLPWDDQRIPQLVPSSSEPRAPPVS